jgi:hypothetical protein
MTDITAQLAEALVILASKNIPTDIQELLVHGNPMRNIPPGALSAALSAYRAQSQPVGEDVKKLLKNLRDGGLDALEAAALIERLSAEKKIAEDFINSLSLDMRELQAQLATARTDALEEAEQAAAHIDRQGNPALKAADAIRNLKDTP